MIIIVSPFFLRNNFDAIAIWPFIVLRSQSLKDIPEFMNHERIHLRQQIELLVIPFYIWYAIEFVLRLIRLNDRRKAYYAISFEREAYAQEANLEYLQTRRFWNFIRFVKT